VNSEGRSKSLLGRLAVNYKTMREAAAVDTPKALYSTAQGALPRPWAVEYNAFGVKADGAAKSCTLI
jgi:hypothetical protein